MKPNDIKSNKQFLRNFPVLFEKYEVFIILAGVAIVFLLAGALFFEKAYKTTVSIFEVSVDLPKVNERLFNKTVEELDARKQMAPDIPIIDPFR